MGQMHSLLKRQLKRQFGDSFDVPAEWRAFIARVDDAYREFDADREMLEHSLELSSQELLDANTEMRAVFQAIPDVVLRADREGTILDIKAGAPGDLMLKRQDLIGKRLQDVPLEDVARQFSEAIAQVFVQDAPVSFEYAAVLHGQESHYEARLVPLPEMQLAVIVRNITERKQSLRLLASAVEQTTESIVIAEGHLVGPGARYLFVNPAFTRMTGYSLAEAVGQTPLMLRGPKTDMADWVRMRETLSKGESYSGETIAYRKDGTEFLMERQVVPLRNSAGAITHFLGMQRDITERKQSEAQLAAAHKELVDISRQAGMAEIATNVLHNVGNILNSVNVSAALINSRLRNSRSGNLARAVELLNEHSADLGDFLSIDPAGKRLPAYLGQLAQALAKERAWMTTELAHLTRSIEHIKDVVATQQSFAGALGVIEPVDICALADDALRMYGDALASQGVTVVREFAILPAVRLDRARVLQILVNLVSNAQQAMESRPPGSQRMTLRVEAIAGACLRVSVEDQGEGIAPENRTRIFAHGFTTRKAGHGFGLHSCALAARQMGGTLTAHSEGPGRGAIFTLELPIDAMQAAP